MAINCLAASAEPSGWGLAEKLLVALRRQRAAMLVTLAASVMALHKSPGHFDSGTKPFRSSCSAPASCSVPQSSKLTMELQVSFAWSSLCSLLQRLVMPSPNQSSFLLASRYPSSVADNRRDPLQRMFQSIAGVRPAAWRIGITWAVLSTS